MSELPAAEAAPRIDPAVYAAYVADLVAGRRSACRDTVQSLLGAGTPLTVIYEQLFRDSLYEIGARWEAGELSVATEHLATAITEDLLSVVYPGAAARSSSRTAIVSCAAGEFHQVGGRIVADSLELRGWDVAFLGANSPDEQLAALLRAGPPQLVALSVSLVTHLPNAERAIALVRAIAPGVPIVLGGQGAIRGGAALAAAHDDVHVFESLAQLDAWLESRFGRDGG